MTPRRAVRVYRALFVVYPRRFRDDYGRDMELLFEAQLRDEPAARVWARALVDLAITAPVQHLEAHVNRPPNPAVPAAFAAVSVAGLVLTVVGGSNLGTFVAGLSVAAVFGVLATASWHRTRTMTEARPVSAQWWKLVVAGSGVFAVTIITVNITGEVPEGWWLPTMFTFLVAVTTVITGLILGIVHLASHRPRHAL